MKFGPLLTVLLLLVACATPAPLRNTKLPELALEHPADYVVVAVRNDAAVSAGRAGATVHGYDAIPGYGASSRGGRLIAAIARDYGLQTVAGWPIDPLHLECVVFRVAAPDSGAAVLAKLLRDPRVKLAEPLQQFRTMSGYNDPYAPLQKSLTSLGLASAHQVSRGAGVRIAVIDTGVSTDHPDLAGGIAERDDYVGGGDPAFRHDLHGTEVAGVIAARANNHLGIVGVAPQAQLIALKACWQPSGQAHALCNTFTLAQAISHAVERGARIVNLSLTGPADPLLSQLVGWGISRGVIFVGAVAGDGGLDGFPADVPGVLAVDRAEASRRNAGVLYAPGDGILTLTPDAHYDFASGSSIAAAQVSGLVALLLEHRQLSAERIRALLISSALSPTGTAPQGTSPQAELTHTVNACGALAAVLGVSCAELGTSRKGSRPGVALAAQPGPASR